jgi:hypothetical protein
MLPELKFNEKMFKALADGRKTVTRRKDPKDICGGLYVAAVCTATQDRMMLKCTGNYTQKISEMTEEDAIREGFYTLDGFKDEIASIYGDEYLQSDPTMWVYEFAVMGRPVVTYC